jgi:thiamine-phosphate pyrophosphorylase
VNPNHLSPAILRTLDANCNRAREALRVLEDYARFTLNHADLSARLKSLRHDFQAATETLQSRAISARDTAGDVGVAITTESEQKRESMAAVVTAAGKRLGEALRTIEEYAKVGSGEALARSQAGDGASAASDRGASRSNPSPYPLPSGAGDSLASARAVTGVACSSVIESLRYRFYDIEKQLLLTLSPGRERMARVRLCVLITEALCRQPWLDVVAAAIAGGADCIQLREKDLDGAELLDRAGQVAYLCRTHGVVSIINDRPDIALLAGADGVHLGQGDLPAVAVRQLLGPDKIIGVSTHEIAHAQQAVLDGADYIGVGPIFPSTTKKKDLLAGVSYAGVIAREIRLPAMAISGIAAQNVAAVLETGLTAVAVSSAVIGTDDPQAAARAIRTALDRR